LVAECAPAFGDQVSTSIGPDVTVADRGAMMTLPGVQPFLPTSEPIVPLVDTENYPHFAAPSPNVSGQDATAASSTAGRPSPSAQAAPSWDTANYLAVTGSASERPSYGHIPPHANTQQRSVSDANFAGPGTRGNSPGTSPP